MTFPLGATFLALFGVSLILTTISLRLLRGTSQAKEATSAPARFFLVCLRLAIGWHCFFEGMEKINAVNWSSEAYLRESMGPMSGVFRGIAGDRLIDKLTVGDDKAFPPELDRDWQRYFDSFASHYQLSDEQLKRAQEILDQYKKETLAYLLGPGEEVTKIAPYPPDLKIKMTMKERLQEYARLQQKVNEIEAKFPLSDEKEHAKWKSAKADLNKWRAELTKSLAAQTAKMKKALEDVLPLPMAAASGVGMSGAPLTQGPVAAAFILFPAPLGVLTEEQGKLKPTPALMGPYTSWRMLEWSDVLVKWGLVVLGCCLMLGFMSRASSLLMALLLLSFFVAMPPLPGWPESPRLEGHYVFINKTLIEVIALLALAFIPTGRWAGIDGLLRCFGRAIIDRRPRLHRDKSRQRRYRACRIIGRGTPRNRFDSPGAFESW